MLGDKRLTEWWKKRLRSLLTGPHKTTWIVVIGVCGLLLIGLSTMMSGEDKTAVVSDDTTDTAAYAAALEQRLAQMVSSISGAGEAQVMVTLENGVEYVYASEEKTNSDHVENNGGQVSVSDDSQKTVVTVDAANGKEGLLITQIEPTVRGVVVACEGASQEAVATMVKEAVKTALNITDKRVCVIPYTLEKEN